jgi:hypothetical protein
LGTVIYRTQKTWNKQNLKSDLPYYKLLFNLVVLNQCASS